MIDDGHDDAAGDGGDDGDDSDDDDDGDDGDDHDHLICKALVRQTTLS